MRHVMLDLETWGTAPGSALRSIGAVEFELDGTVGRSFYCNIDDLSCTTAGLAIDPATEEWWLKQSPEAQTAFLVDRVALPIVVEKFHTWFQLRSAVFIWSQGGNFDEPLWSAAARAVNAPVPWKYWNARCTRTFYDAAGFNPRELARESGHHNALEDALHQIRCVHESVRRLKPQAKPVVATEHKAFTDTFNRAMGG